MKEWHINFSEKEDCVAQHCLVLCCYATVSQTPVWVQPQCIQHFNMEIILPFTTGIIQQPCIIFFLDYSPHKNIEWRFIQGLYRDKLLLQRVSMNEAEESVEFLDWLYMNLIWEFFCSEDWRCVSPSNSGKHRELSSRSRILRRWIRL